MKLKREAKVGIFAVITLFALYWGVNFLKGTDILKRTNTYYAQYDQVGGIQTSSPIVVKGYKIGTVSDIIYDPTKSDKITLELSIEKKYPLPEDSKARIYSDGFLGGKAIEIVMGSSDKHLANGETMRLEADKDFLEVASSELEFFKQRLTSITTDVSRTLGNVNEMLETNNKSLAVTMNNLAEMSSSLKTIITEEEQDLRDIVNNMNKISATLRDNSDKVGGIISNVHEFSDSLRASDISGTINNLSASLAQLNESLGKVNNNDGTLGKLVNDEQLYDSLVSASSNLSLLLEDLRENPGRYVHISVFGRKNK